MEDGFSQRTWEKGIMGSQKDYSTATPINPAISGFRARRLRLGGRSGRADQRGA